MKKLFLCALTACTFFNAKAQDVQNTIKINPLSALLMINEKVKLNQVGGDSIIIRIIKVLCLIFKFNGNYLTI